MKLKLNFLLFFLLFYNALGAQDYYSYADVIQGDKPESKWLFGGYGNLLPLELGPEVAYKITKNLHAGASFSYIYRRRDFNYQGQQRSDATNSWSIRGFVRKKIYRRYYLRLEYEQMNLQFLEPVPNAEFERIWQPGLNAGIETMDLELFGGHAFSGLYWNILYDEDRTAYIIPLSLRVGFYL